MVKENPKISKQQVVDRYILDHGKAPSWAELKFKDMNAQQLNEYQKLRILIKKDRRALKKLKVIEEEEPEYFDESENIPIEKVNALLKEKNPNQPIKEEIAEDYFDTQKQWSNEEKMALVSYTTQKAAEQLLTPEQQEMLKRQKKEDAFIEDYIRNHQIKDQAHMNYAVEHDEKFRIWLEKTNRIKDVYTGRHIKEIEEQKKKVEKELEAESLKDKGNKIIKKFAKKQMSNDFKDAKKELDLTAYRKKKMDAQGFILCMYLRKNGLMDLRYVKMDEVGQIKVDGYVYHERDATYRFGKKNDPVLVIMEGALVPLNKETLKEHLGMESAEAQKLVIKGIEQAEVVKAGGLDDSTKKSFAPPKWLIGVGIAIIIGIYVYMGGFS